MRAKAGVLCILHAQLYFFRRRLFSCVPVLHNIICMDRGVRTVDRPTVYENCRLSEDWNFRDPLACGVCICFMFMSFEKCRLLAHNAANPVTRQSGGDGAAAAEPSLPISRLQHGTRQRSHCLRRWYSISTTSLAPATGAFTPRLF